MAQDRKRFIVRTKMDGTELYLKEFDTYFSPLGYWCYKEKVTKDCTPVLTEHRDEAMRFTENKAKAAKKRAEKAYGNIECMTEKGNRLHFDVEELPKVGRK